MKNFGDTIRSLRQAQDLGLRETAIKVGISPAYLSRIERGKERPPRPDVIKVLAKELATDPDVLFRLSSSTDPVIDNYLKENTQAMKLLRYIIDKNVTAEKIETIIEDLEGKEASSATEE